MKNDIHSWFMSHNGRTNDGVVLTVKPEYGKKAYLGEYRWCGGTQGINVRWDISLPEDSQHYMDYSTAKHVEDVVNESFNYCYTIYSFTKSK